MKTIIRTPNTEDKYPTMGTSFHDHTLHATPDEIQAIMQTIPGDSDKSQYDWEAIIQIGKSSHYFSIYDWKVSRTIRRTDKAIFHIGAETKEISQAVQKAFHTELTKLRQNN